MNQNEAIEKIISEPKFYIGKLPQSTASNFVASYRKGMSKQKTIDEFLQLFGYVKVKDAEYAIIGDLMDVCMDQVKDDNFEVGKIYDSNFKEIQLEGKPSNLKTK